MLLKITKKIGDANITADVEAGSDLAKALVGADWLLNAPKVCSVCKSAEISFSGRKVVAKQGENIGKEFYYAQARCKCGATATIGKLSDGSGYFWRDGGKFEAYAPKNQAAPYSAPQNNDVGGDDIPF
jgi:hypothetical protein